MIKWRLCCLHRLFVIIPLKVVEEEGEKAKIKVTSGKCKTAVRDLGQHSSCQIEHTTQRTALKCSAFKYTHGNTAWDFRPNLMQTSCSLWLCVNAACLIWETNSSRLCWSLIFYWFTHPPHPLRRQCCSIITQTGPFENILAPNIIAGVVNSIKMPASQ